MYKLSILLSLILSLSSCGPIDEINSCVQKCAKLGYKFDAISADECYCKTTSKNVKTLESTFNK